MTQKVTLAGNIIVDNVKTVESWPERGMLSRVLRMERSLGGLVSNTAIYLKTLDPSVDVCAVGCVGSDEPGEFAVSTLSSRGIDVSRVRRVDGPTSFTDVMTLADTGERTFFNMHGADSQLVPDDIDPAKLDCDIFHFIDLIVFFTTVDTTHKKFIGTPCFEGDKTKIKSFLKHW